MERRAIPRRGGLSLRARLIVGFSIFSLLLVILTGYIVYQLQRISDANEALRLQTQRTLAAEALSRTRLDLVLAIDEAILLEDREDFRDRVRARLTTMNARYEDLRRVFDDDVDSALVGAVYNLQNLTEYLIEAAVDGEWEEIRRTRVIALGNEITRISASLDELVAASNRAQTEALEATVQANRYVFRSVLIGAGVAFLIVVVIAYSTIQTFEYASTRLLKGAESFAVGELDHRIEMEMGGEPRQLAEAFNQMAIELQTLYGTLEQRISERTVALESLAEQMRISADVGRMATTILDPERLQEYVVQLISERFGFYHAGLFLINEPRTHAVLKTASSPGGQRMLEQRHRLGLGEGIVGRVMQIGEPYVALDTGGDVSYFDNPDLPETRSEVALPLRVRGETIGILDVQSREPDAFTEENVTVFQSLADQIALALDNARLYQEARERLQEVQQLYGEFSREAWQEIIRAHRTGYRYSAKEGLSETSTWYDEMRTALQTGEPVQSIDPEAESGILAVPVKVREQHVGVLHFRKPPETGLWTDEEIALVQTLVNQIGPTLDSARLFEEAQQRVAHERLIGEITARMREIPVVDAVLETTVREIGESLGLRNVIVRLESGDGAE